jgi:hypothetical protein
VRVVTGGADGLPDELGISSFMVGEFGELDPVVERLAGT